MRKKMMSQAKNRTTGETRGRMTGEAKGRMTDRTIHQTSHPLNHLLTRLRTARSAWLCALAVSLLGSAPAQAQFGGFEPFNVVLSPFTRQSSDVLVVDLNHDGLDDLVTWALTSSFTNGVLARINNGTTPVTFTELRLNIPVGGNVSPSKAVAGDFNGDGWTDIFMVFITSSAVPSIRVLFGDGTGALSLGSNQALSIFQPRNMEVDDIDQDGDLDIVYFASNSEATVHALLNDGTGLFPVQEQIIMESGSSGDGAGGTIADVDGDGINEILVPFTLLSVHALHIYDRPNTASNYQEVSQTVIPHSTTRIAVGDIDNDGDIDLATGRNVGTTTGPDIVQILTNDGTGNFAVTNYSDSGIVDVHLADLDGDGALDLVSVRNVGTTRLIRHRFNDGTGVFGPSTNIAVPNPSSNLSSVSLPDLDGNGTPDLALRQRGPDIFAYALNLTPVTAPGAFALLSPPDGSIDLPLPETLNAWPGSSAPAPLKWATPTGFGVSYTLTVATDPGLANVVLQQAGLSGGTIFNMPPNVLTHSTTYYWSVTASNTAGDTISTPSPFSFSTLCLADLNGDRVLNIFDFLEFQNNFVQGCNR